MATTKSHIAQIGPYRVEEEIGRGGMATVYRVRDAKDQVYALKLLHHNPQQDSRWGTRFQREFRLLSRLRHPHLTEVHDYGEDHDRAYYVMDYIDGMTLWTFYREHLSGMSIEDRLPWILPLTGHVVSALDYIHRHRVVHQDLKPANILLEKDAQIAYLADFGLAKEIKGGTSQFTHAGFIGTLGYAAPEIVERSRMDGRADIYSLGVVLYTVLADRRPIQVEGRHVEELIRAVLHEEPTRLEELVEGIPDNVAELVHRCMRKDPNQRYRSTRELWQDLLPLISTYQRQATVHAPVPTFPQEEMVAQPNFWNESPLIGRQEEFTLSQLRIEQMVQQHQSSAVIFYGIPGIGKSYLLEELSRYTRRSCRSMWSYRLRSQTVPFGSLAELLRVVLENLDPAQYMSSSYHHLASYLPGLPHAQRVNQESLPTLVDPMADLANHLHTLLQRCMVPEGQVWLLDDFHCADIASQEVFKQLLLLHLQQPHKPWVVLFTVSYDPGGTSPSFRLPDHPQIDSLHLLPFSEEEEQQLLEQWTGRVWPDMEFQRIRQASRGIPLRTYELVHQNNLLLAMQASPQRNPPIPQKTMTPFSTSKERLREEPRTEGVMFQTLVGSQTALDSVSPDLDSMPTSHSLMPQGNTAIQERMDLVSPFPNPGFERIPHLQHLPSAEETMLSPILSELSAFFQSNAPPSPPEPTRRARLPKKPTFLSWQDMVSEVREAAPQGGVESTRADHTTPISKDMEETVHRERPTKVSPKPPQEAVKKPSWEGEDATVMSLSPPQISKEAVGDDTAIRTTELQPVPPPQEEVVPLLSSQVHDTRPVMAAVSETVSDEENRINEQFRIIAQKQGTDVGDITMLQRAPKPTPPPQLPGLMIPKVPPDFLVESLGEDTGLQRPNMSARLDAVLAGTSQPDTTIFHQSDIETPHQPDTAVLQKPDTAVIQRPDIATILQNPDTAVIQQPDTAIMQRPDTLQRTITPDTAVIQRPDTAVIHRSELEKFPKPEHREEDGPTAFFPSSDLAANLVRQQESESNDQTPARFTESSEELILIPLLQRRLSMLSPGQHHALACATFLADTFTAEELSAATGTHQKVILDLLNHALSLRILEIHTRDGNEEYAFLYPVSRRLLTASLTAEQRKHIAGRAALAMSTKREVYHKQNNAALLAMRFSEAGQAIRAVQWQLFALAQALAVRVPESQLEVLQQLFHLLQHWAQQGASKELREALPSLLAELRPELATSWSNTCEQLVQVGVLQALRCSEEAQAQTSRAQDTLRSLMKEYAQSDPSSIRFLYQHLQPLLQFAHLDFVSQRS